MSNIVKKIPFIVIAILLTVCGRGHGAILLDRVVAIVDREVITWSELYRAMTMEYRPLMEGMNKEDRKAYLEKVQHEFIDKLINMKLQIEAAKRAGFSVSEDEVNAAIGDIRTQYKFTPQEFKRALEQDGIEYSQYRNMLRDQILISKIVANEIRSKVIVTDEEIDDYIDKNKEDLPLELSYKLFEVHLKTEASSGGESELEKLTDEIYSRLRSGEKLEDFIKVLERSNPGKIVYKSGYIHASEMRNDFREALKNLESGQVTSPISVKDGVYVLKILEKEAPVTLDIVRGNIRELLSNIKTGDLHGAWIKKLRQSAFIEIKL